MKLRAVLATMLLVLAPALPAAESDALGSRDPLGIERFPRSWIVDYQRDAEVRPREFVMGRVERLRRDVRVQDLLRVESGLESATYRIPDGVPVADVAAHFHTVLEGAVLFRCTGRDCGRSNEWANQIFGKALLYGPDGNQAYMAREWQGRLISVYVIERGNRRVYAHLQVLDPADETVLAANALLLRRLTGQGWAVIDSVVPAPGGTLPQDAADLLGALGGELVELAGSTVYLVCHLYGAQPVEELLAASSRCAEAGVAALGGDQAAPRALDLRPFGAGPLLPRGNLRQSRLELVAPALLDGAGNAAHE
jgi:hypothetical protein